MDGKVEIVGCAVNGIEETVYVPALILRPWLARARKSGTVVRSAPCTVDGQPAYAVTVAYR